MGCSFGIDIAAYDLAAIVDATGRRASCKNPAVTSAREYNFGEHALVQEIAMNTLSSFSLEKLPTIWPRLLILPAWAIRSPWGIDLRKDAIIQEIAVAEALGIKE